MRTVLSRSAHADQLEAEVRDATCCVAADRCWSCEFKVGEVRAIRRDALLHSISTVRPRRPVRGSFATERRAPAAGAGSRSP